MRAYFAWMLLAGTDNQPSFVEARDAIRFLNEWGIWHGDEEEELPGDGPLPPDLQAHADGVLPEVIERPEDPEPWWWSGAAATIGINYQIVAGRTHQADPRLGDVLLVALSQVATHARAAPPEILEQLEQLKADYELVTGREPELLDPSIFELGEEDQ